MAPEYEAEFETKMPEDEVVKSAEDLTASSEVKVPKLVRRDTPIFT